MKPWLGIWDFNKNITIRITNQDWTLSRGVMAVPRSIKKARGGLRTIISKISAFSTQVKELKFFTEIWEYCHGWWFDELPGNMEKK